MLKYVERQGIKRGASKGALVNINKIFDLRILTKPELKNDNKFDYIVSMDVARSESKSNNQSSIAIIKIIRNKKNKISNLELVNLINLENGLNFTNQAIELKRIRKMYNAKMVVVDGNGLGKYFAPLYSNVY